MWRKLGTLNETQEQYFVMGKKELEESDFAYFYFSVCRLGREQVLYISIPVGRFPWSKF